MLSSVVVALLLVAGVQSQGFSGGCSAPTQNFNLDLYAGSNNLLFYVDKLNTIPSVSPGTAFVTNDALISSPTEGYQYVGSPGDRFIDQIHLGLNSYVIMSTNDEGPIFTNPDVQYFGMGFKNIYGTVPSSMSFTAEVFVSNSPNYIQVNNLPCNINGTGYIFCTLTKNELGGHLFDTSTIISLRYNLFPQCSAQAFCSQVGWAEGSIGYFCDGTAPTSNYYECLSGPFAPLSAVRPCAPGTYCNCAQFVECSDNNLVSPCQ